MENIQSGKEKAPVVAATDALRRAQESAGRVDTSLRVAEAEAALHQSRLKADDVELGRFQPILKRFDCALRGLQFCNRFNQRKRNPWTWINATVHRFLDGTKKIFG